MEIEDIRRLAGLLGSLGCEAVTITGGGEPLMHPDFPGILRAFAENEIEIGLVSNALLFPHKIKEDGVLDLLTWCRISISDDRPTLCEGGELTEAITYAVEMVPSVDWAFSYVVTAEFNPEKFMFSVDYANEHNFTHMRAVSDLFDLDNVPSMEEIHEACVYYGVDDDIVIYQGRKEYEHGAEDCLISLIKPVIDSSGRVFPCCGAQYALKEPTKNMPDELCMGTFDDLPKIIRKQKHFNGSVCHRCYYGDYNRTLFALQADIDHEKFI